jgi:hypothetical protein
MITHSRRPWLVTAAGLAVLVFCAGPAHAQESKSAPLAKELTQLLDQSKLTTIAAKDSQGEGQYVAAMYFPGSQLLVVGARYAVPVLLDAKLNEAKYMDVYIDLNSASVAGTKVFVSDLMGDGLKARPGDEEPFDTYEAGGQTTSFDHNLKAQGLTEDEYMKRFADADARYTHMLTVLVNQLKKK